MGGDCPRQRFGGLVVEGPIQVSEYTQGVLTRSLGNQPGDLQAMLHQHDLLLIALDGIEHRAEVVGHFRY